MREKIINFINKECYDLHTFIGEDWVAFTNYEGERSIVNLSKGYDYIKTFAEHTREENQIYRISRHKKY